MLCQKTSNGRSDARSGKLLAEAALSFAHKLVVSRGQASEDDIRQVREAGNSPIPPDTMVLSLGRQFAAPGVEVPLQNGKIDDALIRGEVEVGSTDDPAAVGALGFRVESGLEHLVAKCPYRQIGFMGRVIGARVDGLSIRRPRASIKFPSLAPKKSGTGHRLYRRTCRAEGRPA